MSGDSLCIETSARHPSVWLDGEGGGRWILEPGVPLSSELGRRDPVWSFAEALKAGEADLSTISNIVVNRGPGRYTGLRVGLAMAQGLALTRAIPVICHEMTDILIQRWRLDYPGRETLVGVLVDARANSVITATYKVSTNSQQRIGDVHCCALDEALAFWSDCLPIVGSAVIEAREHLVALGHEIFDLDPDAQSLAILQSEQPGSEIPAAQLIPNYARSPL